MVSNSPESDVLWLGVLTHFTSPASSQSRWASVKALAALWRRTSDMPKVVLLSRISATPYLEHFKRQGKSDVFVHDLRSGTPGFTWLQRAPNDDMNALNIALRDFTQRSEVFEDYDVLRKANLSRIEAELRNRTEGK